MRAQRFAQNTMTYVQVYAIYSKMERRPKKNEVANACSHISQIAKNELSHAEPIEWYDDALIVSDPFLLFFLKWQRENLSLSAS